MGPVCDRVRCARRVVAAVLIACLAGCTAKPPDLPAGSIEAVEIRLHAQPKRQKTGVTQSTDGTKIEVLLAVLRSAKAAEDHKCGDSGEITLRRKDKDEVKIGILAGHDPQHYEFRVYQGTGPSYDIFRVERVSFLKAMVDIGVGDLDPGLPE